MVITASTSPVMNAPAWSSPSPLSSCSCSSKSSIAVELAVVDGDDDVPPDEDVELAPADLVAVSLERPESDEDAVRGSGSVSSGA